MSTIHLISFALPVFTLFAWFAAAKNCENLNGTWYNQRGGELYLEQGSDGRLLGEYKTAEERLNSSGQVAHSIVLGEYKIFLNFCSKIIHSVVQTCMSNICRLRITLCVPKPKHVMVFQNIPAYNDEFSWH